MVMIGVLLNHNLYLPGESSPSPLPYLGLAFESQLHCELQNNNDNDGVVFRSWAESF